MNKEKLILVGKIVAPQGLRGEVRVQTYTENPTDFKDFKNIAGVNGFKFVRALPGSAVIIAKVAGVDERNGAEALRGTELFVRRGDLPDLAAGEFYHDDLIGMSVGDNKVVAVHNFGAGDILELDNGEMVSISSVTIG